MGPLLDRAALFAIAQAFVRVTVILVPSYTAAYITGEMVWTVPTLAASAAVAASITIRSKPVDRSATEINVDADDDGGDVDDAVNTDGE